MSGGEHEDGPAPSRRLRARLLPSQHKHGAPSIRARLVLLVLVLLVPPLLLAGVLLWSLHQQVNRMQDRQLSATARTLGLVVDARIGEQAAALQGLAVSSLLTSGDWAGFSAQARAALYGSESWVVVQFPSGEQVVNTFPGPRTAGATAPPRRVQAATSSGRRGPFRVSNLTWGPVARQPVIVVGRTVVLDKGGTANLSVVTPAASFSRLLARQELPPRWTATVFDADRRLVARSRDGDRFVGYQASSSTIRALATERHLVLHTHTLDGVAGITAFAELPGYGWTAVVAMPRDEAVGVTEQAMLLVVVIGALLILAAVSLALRMGGSIARPVETVARAASDWVAGADANFPAETGLSETDGLSRAFAAALQAVEQRDERQKLLMNELNHRVKNTLATVQAVALHTRAGAASTEAYHAALEGRVIAMSRAHEILTRTAWEGAEFSDLARETLDAFAGQQLKIEGPSIQVAPTDALNLALILYELATNAAKHGALSQPGGEVVLGWRLVDGQVRVSWVESGGPTVRPPARRGFGSRLITRATRDLQPSMFRFDPEGVRCSFTLAARRG